MLGLDQWDGSSNSVQSFRNVTNVTFPLLLNASGVAADYSTTYDRLILIDKSGKIVYSGSQVASTGIQSVIDKIVELLN